MTLRFQVGLRSSLQNTSFMIAPMSSLLLMELTGGMYKLGLYSNDVLCRVAFGRDFSQGGDYDRHGFQKMLDEYQVLLGGFSVGDFFPSMDWISSLTGMKKRLEETFRRFDRFFDEIIEEHRDPKRAIEEHKDLVDVLLDVQKNGSLDMPLTMDNIKAVILDMFAAGTDTTFITLDWGMTELITNPRVMKKAQDEVQRAVGDRSIVLESDLQELHYLKAVIKRDLPAASSGSSISPKRVHGRSDHRRISWAVLWIIRGRILNLYHLDLGGEGALQSHLEQLLLSLLLLSFSTALDWELPPHGIDVKDLNMTEVFGISMHRIDELIVVARPRFT
ncbi:cytochrome P450 71A1-like protein [Cinnamomum micranthum f. kanehirae]|uniref:Cytochrome P450 71A1-like protein n=1 Tax=Cinnamomum micranthum f. kanehirae TaxID=337451 RepID=A0A3S3ME30_9MAGN|nr:cytochrome P450 71A1-like protein [Cinnamomum micranthum f. kanehirae]